MVSIFRDRKYARLLRLREHWGISLEDLYYAVENEFLHACVWMPLRYLERGTIRDRQFVFMRHEAKEGFVGVRPRDFRTISSVGSARLRSFDSVTRRGTVLRLPDEPRQPALLVRIEDLMVLAQDRAEFEREYRLRPYDVEGCAAGPLAEFLASDDYRHIRINGEEHHFGDVQAHVIKILHAASLGRSPWVHGKTLLDGAGSHAARLRDVFKSKRDWRRVILSDKRGSYRLNVPWMAAEPEGVAGRPAITP
ncbi:hypothetical protein [Singulisphaera sp. PoT]|uniref:hypothetical protein n=1 Tax=Singulisphaera sp. PoT TaxID=3411797 RepID=UPI003BF553B3